ncbi:hypothetical protein DLD99_22435 [Pseudomonas kribbensis]|uniref:Uncharacterized protein n=1 Tax=Pseudomonas kribbensis TaxID=1628086 RepID=A0A345RUZ8_9PSED|nr:hypothetical protein [Pseudomonas kribbensis]AXI63114.1 hypothetical protein DLD99_22435 [Pseudomonas kribbensis]
MNSLSVTSQTWLQNFRPYVNGERVRWLEFRLMLAAGESVDLTLEFEYSYLIGDPESSLQLLCEPNAESVGLVCDPPFGQLVEMAEGLISLTWHISSSQTSNGPFELHFEMPDYQGMPHSPEIPGAVINFVQEVDVLFDKFTATFDSSTVYPCHGASHTLTVRPKLSSQFLNKPVKLLWSGEPAEKLGVKVWPSLVNELILGEEGLKWELDCSSTSINGEFSLQMAFIESKEVSLPLTMSLGHNLVTAERWREQHEQWPEWKIWYSYHIRAKSAFTNNVVSGAKVTLEWRGGTSYMNTNSQGEARYNDKSGLYLRMFILNRYDGSTVRMPRL